MRLGPEEVRRIARLARLELDDEEIGRLAEEMEAVLRRFREVEAAASASTPPEGRAGPGEDAGPEVSDSEGRAGSDEPGSDPLLLGPDRFAPDWREGHFVTPSPAAWQDLPDASPPSDRDR